MIHPPVNGLARFVTRHALLLLVLSSILTLLSWGPSNRLSFDQSIESLFSDDNPRLQAYLKSRDYFGGDEFVFIAFSEENLDSPETESRILALSRKLQAVPGIAPGSVQDFVSALRPARIPFVAIPDEKLLELARGIVVGEDGKTTAIVGRFEPAATASVPRPETIESIRELAREFDEDAYVVGEPIHIQEMFRYVEEDGLWLWIYSAGLLGLVLLALFLSLRWTLLPVVIVAVTVLWTRAILVVSGMKLSMVSSMLNSLVTIIGVATVVHFMLRYRELRSHMSRSDSIETAISQLLWPVLWTTVTTAAGFGSLLSSRIAPVESFGFMMLLGTLLILPACLGIAPGFSGIGNFDTEVRGARTQGFLSKYLGKMGSHLEQVSGVVTLVTLILIAGSIYGCMILKIETDFSKNFRDASPIRKGLAFIESRLGGAGTWEVRFPAPETISEEFLDKVRSFAEELRGLQSHGEKSLTKVLALTDGLDLIPIVPFISTKLESRLKLIDRFQPEFQKSLYNPEQKVMRIVLRAREQQPSESKLAVIKQVEDLVVQRFGSGESSGLFVLLTFLIESLLGDQWVSFAISATAVTLCMTVAFKSLWIGVISLVPNVFPILLVLGTMGLLDLPINIATAMIASVSLGMTVDSSIHYLFGYLKVRRSGGTHTDALRDTHQDIGLALLLANFALVAGFSVLTVSHFIPMVYFGILFSLSLIGGLIGNLVLLPLLLGLGERWGLNSPSEGE